VEARPCRAGPNSTAHLIARADPSPQITPVLGVLGESTEFFVFESFLCQKFPIRPPENLNAILDPFLGAIGYGAEFTHLGAIDLGAELPAALSSTS
jgi:hypothetical protein